MILVHTSQSKVTTNNPPLRVKCNSGAEMYRTIQSIASLCNKKKENKSHVIWDSQHHEILLWFEQEKYMTFFELSGIPFSQ